MPSGSLYLLRDRARSRRSAPRRARRAARPTRPRCSSPSRVGRTTIAARTRSAGSERLSRRWRGFAAAWAPLVFERCSGGTGRVRQRPILSFATPYTGSPRPSNSSSARAAAASRSRAPSSILFAPPRAKLPPRPARRAPAPRSAPPACVSGVCEAPRPSGTACTTGSSVRHAQLRRGSAKRAGRTAARAPWRRSAARGAHQRRARHRVPPARPAPPGRSAPRRPAPSPCVVDVPNGSACTLNVQRSSTDGAASRACLNGTSCMLNMQCTSGNCVNGIREVGLSNGSARTTNDQRTSRFLQNRRLRFAEIQSAGTPRGRANDEVIIEGLLGAELDRDGHVIVLGPNRALCSLARTAVAAAGTGSPGRTSASLCSMAAAPRRAGARALREGAPTHAIHPCIPLGINRRSPAERGEPAGRSPRCVEVAMAGRANERQGSPP